MARLIGNKKALVFSSFQNEAADAEEFIASGAYVNDTDSHGYTALHHAIRRGNIHLMKTLLKAGAKVNVVNNEHVSPLHMAVMHQQRTAARLLLKTGRVRVANQIVDADVKWEVLEKLVLMGNRKKNDVEPEPPGVFDPVKCLPVLTDEERYNQLKKLRTSLEEKHRELSSSISPRLSMMQHHVKPVCEGEREKVEAARARKDGRQPRMWRGSRFHPKGIVRPVEFEYVYPDKGPMHEGLEHVELKNVGGGWSAAPTGRLGSRSLRTQTAPGGLNRKTSESQRWSEQAKIDRLRKQFANQLTTTPRDTRLYNQSELRSLGSVTAREWDFIPLGGPARPVSTRRSQRTPRRTVSRLHKDPPATVAVPEQLKAARQSHLPGGNSTPRQVEPTGDELMASVKVSSLSTMDADAIAIKTKAAIADDLKAWEGDEDIQPDPQLSQNLTSQISAVPRMDFSEPWESQAWDVEDPDYTKKYSSNAMWKKRAYVQLESPHRGRYSSRGGQNNPNNTVDRPQLSNIDEVPLAVSGEGQVGPRERTPRSPPQREPTPPGDKGPSSISAFTGTPDPHLRGEPRFADMCETPDYDSEYTLNRLEMVAKSTTTDTN